MKWLWRVLGWLRLILLSVLILFVTLLTVVSAIVVTEPGSRWAINLVVDRVPQLTLGRIQGNMLTGLDVNYVDYQFEGQQYRVDGLAFRWQPLALFYREVSVQSLRADSVLLVLPVSEGDEPVEPEAPFEWPSLGLPVTIALGQVQLNNIRIHQGETVTELEQVSGSIRYGTFNVRAYDLTVIASDYRATVSGRLGLSFPYSSELDIDWQYQLPATDERAALPLAGSAQLQGDIEYLELEHQLSSPVVLDTSAQITPNLTDPDLNPYLVVDNNWQEQSPPDALWTLDQPVPVTTARVQIEGWLDDYRVQLSGDIAADGLPSLILQLDGRGDLTQIVLDAFDAEVEGVTLSTTGQIAWAEPATEQQISWDLALAINEFNPDAFLEDWPGRLQMSAETRGHVNGEDIQAQLENLSLSGLLRGLELSGSGDVAYAAGRIDTQNLRMTLGANQLNVHGYVADTFDLQWELIAPILGQVDPSLGGSIKATGQLEGSVDRPHLQLSVVADRLRWLGYGATELALSLDRDAVGVYTLNGRAADIQLNEQVLEQLVVDGAGTLERHRVSLDVASEAVGNVALTVTGGYDEQRWQGNFDALELRLMELPRWELLGSELMAFEAGQFELGAQCLTTRAGRFRGRRTDETAPPETDIVVVEDDPDVETPSLCIEGEWLADAGLRLEADISAIPLRLLRFWLKPEARLSGVIDGRVEVRQTPADGLTASALLQTRDGEFRYQYADEDLDVYAWRSAELRADFVDDELVAAFVTDWESYGSAEAEVTLNTRSRALAGNLRARFGDLAPLEALIPRLHEVRGALSADLRLEGTLDDPVLLGQINLRDGTANLPELGLVFENTSLTIESSQNGRVNVTGSISSGDGSLALKADMEGLGQHGWQLSASVDGENFQIIQDRQLQTEVSPTITARASAQEIRIEGLARIPKARANIKTLPATATGLSNDVVILDGRDNGNGGAMGIPWYLNVRLQLGDDVRFEGFGLESRLSGELLLVRTPTRGLLTTGDVGVASGLYKAYGQELTIERGRLIFQGPYDNPGLDIRAERIIDDVVPEITVGLEIGGTLQRPRSRVFSTPAQSESEAMAMLLTGRSLSGTSSADASMLVNAIGNLGLERSNFITAEIAQTFGLDEITVQTGDTFEDSSLFIGKYLTPRLFVRYVRGLFDQTDSMGLRYQLTDSLRLEAESGLHQSVDLIYKFER